MNLIRFPPSAKWSEPMATRASWVKRTWWRLFGHRRKVTKVKLEKVRRYS